MFKVETLDNLDDYFVKLNQRKNKGVFFYRINAYNAQVDSFVRRYYEAARVSGVVIEGRVQNPDSRNIEYYTESMGVSFNLDLKFILDSLKKWLPRMNELQRKNVAESIYNTLLNLKCAGKNENMLKNTYIKFMCWLYYKFERIVNQLGADNVPKILYEGTISSYELLLMSVLSAAGCDVILLQYSGDAEYLKLDPKSERSLEYTVLAPKPFPASFNLKQVRADIQKQAQVEMLYGERPAVSNCTNAWGTGKPLGDVRMPLAARGKDSKLFYNYFCRITGVEDKLTYQNELYQLQQELRNSKRNVVIVNGPLTIPTPEEVSHVQRDSKCHEPVQMVQSLARNLNSIPNQTLQRIVRKAFVDIALEASEVPDTSLNRLMNRMIYLICWFKRHMAKLFTDWKPVDVGCFFYMGTCKSESESLFFKFLARLPVDILIFNPNLNESCCLEDELLYEVHYPNSLTLTKFPESISGVQVGTAAFQAERELDTIMYQDTGIYRNQQYVKATSITLQTMYEEISILWDQELKYRPNFSVVGDTVNVPVIYAKVCGIKDGDVNAYWREITKLATPDTIIIRKVPHITADSLNPVKAVAAQFLQNGRVQKDRIKRHSVYQYSILREPVQDYLLDKIQLLIDQRSIKGTFETGVEYAIVSTALNLDKETLRLIQKFDFTKKNPKLIYIITGETTLSLEDTIYAAFLNLLGFDVAFFVPTGYQSVERHFKEKVFVEHQIGEYVYDLAAPDFGVNAEIKTARQSWWERVFG